MPVTYSRSSVKRWPSKDEVDRAVREWADRVAREKEGVVRIGYFGSYARGDWGVGSDVDIVVIVEASSLPYERRGTEWDVLDLPVPADVLVYTLEEWEALSSGGARMWRTIMEEAVWVWQAGRASDPSG
ncbi:nucleotidyltransferase domain-containing protein [Spirochaeta thermophila]|uniref:Putative nucleotidyltransferase domain protein n=1 Tax=Winmispira thermophila (strain ATCC 49972 / DSM 6192 / RI 19.B1) TaxID=665571 RepID=E0RP98_WINT6|nr:nucleotidyltransferase domain-containing protein [Spirochaeta thermophila]ADN01292.1 putative nucleotidyltransferase domain protein [Spirochaeta thermophila DSM 6192]